MLKTPKINVLTSYRLWTIMIYFAKCVMQFAQQCKKMPDMLAWVTEVIEEEPKPSGNSFFVYCI